MSKQSLTRKVPRKFPEAFSRNTIDIVNRIEKNNEVVGLLHIQNDSTTYYNTLHNSNLAYKIPSFTAAVQRAVAEITQEINKVNPIIDRIIADDSVDGVVMTNEEGTPILTNMIAAQATSYGNKMKRLGVMAHYAIKEIDTFDEMLVFRIATKKREIMAVTNSLFNIIVVQRQGVAERKKNEMADKKKKKSL